MSTNLSDDPDAGWDVDGDTGATPTTILRAVCATTACRGSADGIEAMAVAASVDLDGNPVPPDVAAERVVQILRDARSNGSEPLGVVVAADLELVGLRDDPVFLSWEMWQHEGTTRLHDDWLNKNLAYRLEPNTDHDSATLDLWVPMPTNPGPYYVRIQLTHAGSGLASADSAPFE
jgi:hypothetical protein